MAQDERTGCRPANGRGAPRAATMHYAGNTSWTPRLRSWAPPTIRWSGPCTS